MIGKHMYRLSSTMPTKAKLKIGDAFDPCPLIRLLIVKPIDQSNLSEDADSNEELNMLADKVLSKLDIIHKLILSLASDHDWKLQQVIVDM